MNKHFAYLMLSLFLATGVWTYAADNAVTSQIHALEQQKKTDLQNLTQQVADLKARHQSETAPHQQQLDSLNSAFQTAMKQLHDQYDETRNHDDDELAALMDRIKPGYLALYNEKKQSLASAHGQEDQAIQGLRQQEDTELQSIREKYDAQLKSLRQDESAKRQAIVSQFDTAVKALK
jgi:hypothetical protein